MKGFPTALCLTSLLAMGSWLTGCATPPPHARAAANDYGPPGGARDLGCSASTPTPSRIAPADRPCTMTGRSYSSEDISRTGASTAGEALQLLDPSISVHH